MVRRVAVWVTLLLASVTLFVPAGGAVAAPPPTDTVPISTVNEFLPEDRSIGECISAVPKPGCGSEERGGWRQYLVAVAMVGGLVFVGWRVVVGVRRGRQEPAPG